MAAVAEILSEIPETAGREGGSRENQERNVGARRSKDRNGRTGRSMARTTDNNGASKAAEVFVSESSSIDRRGFLQQLAALAAMPAVVQTPTLERDLPGLLKKYGVPGLSYAVIENGTSIRAAGFGVKKAGSSDPVTADTMFEAASLSKPPFAYLVLKLAELGRIKLDAPIGSFFKQPDFVNEPAVDAITPRIVLSHRTGLLNWRPAQQPMPLLFKPGSQFGYSGEAYVRLQRFIEQTTATPLDALSRNHLFVPFKMERSSYTWRPEYAQLAAEGHKADGESMRTRLWAFEPTGPSAMKLPPGVEVPPMFAVPNAAASLYSSATEYARFLSKLLAPPAPDGIHLSAASLDAMFTSVAKVNDELSWGLGWGLARVDGEDTFWHWGNNGPYQAFIVGSRRRRWATVIFTNSANGLKLCREVVTRLLRVEHPAFRWSSVLR